VQAGALAPYEDSLLSSEPLAGLSDDGRVVDFDVARWLAPVDQTDLTVLARCAGQVLDVGCGPGRFVRALAECGVVALGLDIADTAVALTRRNGGLALRRSVFDDTPAEGRWSTILLMDGNIGIGGDAGRLMTRIATLLAPTGRLIVEVATDTEANEVMRLRFARNGRPVGRSFDWATIGYEALRRVAECTGYSMLESWSSGGRTFAALGRTAA
jgi:SAM-dependent methyltransferase